ncbi:M20/M25/M40 family metallo-hydrolase [Myxococcota bacterium]|nr:M20/M25/M40 family metallo-hydrolase [Myxococcota bacterium]
MLGLGGSVGTPPGGIEADVVVARDFAHLESLGEAVRGRIVLFDVPFTDYGETVAYRGRGASAAARLGAVAVLIRSVTPTSLSTPHTGALGYAGDAPRIPAAALTVEDAASLHRLADRGIVPRVRLEMGARTAPDGTSANVVGEVRGREHPGEVVVLGCHLDSWDVGQGAQDDGAGCVTVLEAARLIGALPQRPRRTVRVVFYTNEENGLRGARAYAEQHRDELPRHVAAVEADTGSGAPLGFRVHVPGGGDGGAESPLAGEVMDRLRGVGVLLEPLSAAHLRLAHGGADIGPLVTAGVPGFGLDQDMSGYWPIHHTAADTFDKVDPKLLARNVAAVAVLAYWLAEIPESLPRPPPGGAAP